MLKYKIPQIVTLTPQCDSDRNLHKLPLVIFPEVLMKYFESSF